ncbi:hypothetical protein VT25_03885 [Photobacterium leiognathi subsp. mandapamensis]|nr:hypothetical protein VT25_03885 [Photobacterium leiognathi subsp. mandapamensis]
MIEYFIVPFCLFLFSLLSTFRNEKFGKVLVCFLYVILIFLYSLVCFRGNIDRDHQNYLNIYSYIVNGINYNIEFTFTYLSVFINYLKLNPTFIFIIFGLFGVTLKIRAIYKFSQTYNTLFYLCLLVYTCSYLFLHEMTQIRIGVACGFFLLSILYYADNKKLKSFLLILVSACFHISSLMGLIIFSLSNNKIGNKEKIISYLMFFISLIFAFTKLSFFTLILNHIPIDIIQMKLTHYADEDVTRTINIFNIQFFVYIVVLFILYEFSGRLYLTSKYAPIISRVFYLSIISKLLLSSTPIFAMRVSEFYAVTSIFVMPLILYAFKSKYISFFIPVIISILLLVNFILIQKILLPYEYFTYSSPL